MSTICGAGGGTSATEGQDGGGGSESLSFAIFFLRGENDALLRRR
jgi:hypothetical protein